MLCGPRCFRQRQGSSQEKGGVWLPFPSMWGSCVFAWPISRVAGSQGTAPSVLVGFGGLGPSGLAALPDRNRTTNLQTALDTQSQVFSASEAIRGDLSSKQCPALVEKRLRLLQHHALWKGLLWTLSRLDRVLLMIWAMSGTTSTYLRHVSRGSPSCLGHAPPREGRSLSGSAPRVAAETELAWHAVGQDDVQKLSSSIGSLMS